MNTLVHSATLKCVNDKGSIAFTITQCPPGYKLKSTIVEKPNYVPPAEQSTGHYTRQTSKEYSSSSDCYDTEMGKLKLHDGDPLASLAAMNAGFRTIKAKCSAMFPSDKKKKKAKEDPMHVEISGRGATAGRKKHTRQAVTNKKSKKSSHKKIIDIRV